MIAHTEYDQGSAEWYEARLGIPTASEFHRIVTPTGKLSAQSRPYAIRLATEKLLNRTLDAIDNLEWVERGRLLEPQAVKAYEFEYDATTERVAFCTTDDGRIGASPDRLTADRRGGVEIKCTAPQTHLAYLIDGPGNDYKPQVQGQMMVAELEWVDFFSYSPEMPPVRIRIERDEPYIATLREALGGFNLLLDIIMAKAKDAGMYRERRKLLTPASEAYDRSAGPPDWLGLPE